MASLCCSWAERLASRPAGRWRMSPCRLEADAPDIKRFGADLIA